MTDDLQPGPEADALVAEAMGWTRVRHVGVDISFSGMPPNDVGPQFIPAYTTTGDGMLEMLDWMRGAPREWTVINTHRKHWTECRIPWRAVQEQSDTAPLAVAKALLAACEEADE